MKHERLAVCSWSLQPQDPRDLVAKLRATGISRVQLALDPLWKKPEVWGGTATLLRENGVAIVSGMVGCVGEDYTTLESIRLTGGVAPDGTWEENQRNMRAAAALAEASGIRLVTFHAGFLPAAEETGFAKMIDRLQTVAGLFAERGVALALETGQETAEELAHLLQRIEGAKVGVNFDPANMIMYDKGDPVAGVRKLGPWIRQAHIKDARRTKTSGTWGAEAAVGTGEVDWRAFFAALREAAEDVDLVIEREHGTERVADIRRAKSLVEDLLT